MLPSVMEAVGLMIISGVLFQAGHSLFSIFRRRAMVGQELAEEIDGFRNATENLLVQARTGRMSEEQTWSGFRKFYIHRRVDEAEGITSFYLRPYDGKTVPRFLPGQHLTFRLQIPGNPKPIIRCYSLSDAPVYQNQYRVTIKRQTAPEEGLPDGVGSSFFHEALDTGRIVDVKAPGGNFYLDLTDRRPAVLIAGGIGLTAMVSMLNTLCVTRSNRDVWFFYSVRNRHEHAMSRHLKQLAREHHNVNIVICYSRPTPDCVKGRDYHYHGRVDRRLLQGLISTPNCQFYMCGPLAMQDSLTEELKAWGVAAKDIRSESFGRRKGKKSKTPAVDDMKQAAEAIEIVFARSGKIGKWVPGDDSILDVAEAAGVMIDSGCRAGQCGTCVTAIKEGSVDYVEEPSDPPPAGSCLACVAIPRKGLVLDA